MGTTLLWVEGVALSVFIAAGSWGLVRAGLIGLAESRYFQLRAERYAEAAEWPRARYLGRTPLLLASIACWPAAVVFVLAWAYRIVASGPWMALLASWPVVAVVLLFLDSRSPWARLRTILSAAASVPIGKRDDVLANGFAVDPQLNGTLKP